MIPYKGASPGLTALLGGHVEVAIPSFALVQPQWQADKVRILLTSKKIPSYPQIPTLTQLDINATCLRLVRILCSGWSSEASKKVLASALEKSIKSADVLKLSRRLGPWRL